MSTAKASKEEGRAPRFRISIAVALTLSLTGLVFVGAVAVLALGFGTAAVNTRTLLGDKAVLSIELLTEKVRETIDGAANGNAYLAGLITRGRLDLSDRDRAGRAISAAPWRRPRRSSAWDICRQTTW